MTRISLTINSDQVDADVEPRTSLADFLRNSRGLTGTHLGCEHGVCGACTVSMDGSPARSCILYAVQVHGRSVVTIEGFDDDATMSDLRSEFSKQHALQCGFCTPGMLITARDIVTRLGNPGEARVREELAGNLCRCTGYSGIVQAVQNVGLGREGVLPVPLLVAKPVAAQRLVIEESDLAPTRPTQPEKLNGGEIVIEQAIVLDAASDQVWKFFQSVPDVAACIPGAGLTRYDADTWDGVVRINMGPIRAQLKGKGTYKLVEVEKTGSMVGAGADDFSSSRVRGALDFALTPGGENATKLTLTLSYSLQGVLVQFSRSNLAKEFVRAVVQEFGRNVEARLSGRSAPSQATSFNLSGALRLVIASWWRRWRGDETALL
jgi:aerobic carbon-monoxide dehydrogenase small subunit